MKIKPHWQILAALLLAIVTAVVLQQLSPPSPAGTPEQEAAGVAAFVENVVEASTFVGDLFKRALLMLIVPLIVSSVVAGIASLHGMRGFGRLGGKTVAFYAMTSFLAILVGLFLVNVIRPGLTDGQPNELIQQAFAEQEALASEEERERIAAASDRKSEDIWDVFKRMIPVNIFAAATENGQMLGLITFSILFAIAMTRLPAQEMKSLRDFFQSLNDVMIIVTRWVMAVAPIGIYALVLPVVYSTGPELFLTMGKYVVTVLLALGTHMFVTMPLILKFLGKVSPWAHFRAMRTALITAFSTSSSSATLSVTMRAVQENAGVSKRTSSFTLPLGATVNMDGTALYECVAVIFVAQAMGFSMGFGTQFMVVVIALLTSIGVAGIPSASLVAIILIMNNVNVPGANVAPFLLLAIDRPLDMCRTAVNVFGDSCAAVVIGKSEGEVGILEDVPSES